MSRSPRPEDVVYLANEENFVYVQHVESAAEDPIFEILDFDGEAYRVVRAADKDRLLRAAAHDDDRRRAWRIIPN
jgi:hypothetical protein